MRRTTNGMSTVFLSNAPLAACFALAACSTTVRNFGDGDGGAGDGGAVGSMGGSNGDGGSACPAPFTRCDGGCTDISIDPANCGACGNGCPAPAGAVATCDGFRCGHTCDGTHGECNGLPDDGCETDIAKDVVNCGACGNVCPDEGGATATCDSGTCGLLCARGFADCQVTVPGCETSILNDPAHCGGCGLGCPRGLTCLDGTCRPGGLTGATGDVWELVSGPSPGSRGLQEYVPHGSPHMYAGSGTSFLRYDIAAGSWESLAAPPISLAGWGSLAFSGGFLWEVRAAGVVRFDPPANAWSTVRSDVAGGDQDAMTTVDGAGHLWSFNAAKELVEYDPIADVLSYHPTGVSADTYETRLGWDRPSNSIFFGGFVQPILNRYDIASGTVRPVAPHPEPYLNDIFCADRSGHLYSAGDGMGTTLWQYDIASNTWRRIPDYPADHGNNGSCSVHEDGWLYVEPGDSVTLYRLRLL
jgi:hypothetical protein